MSKTGKVDPNPTIAGKSLGKTKVFSPKKTIAGKS
jgi:hypothetical protein